LNFWRWTKAWFQASRKKSFRPRFQLYGPYLAAPRVSSRYGFHELERNQIEARLAVGPCGAAEETPDVLPIFRLNLAHSRMLAQRWQPFQAGDCSGLETRAAVDDLRTGCLGVGVPWAISCGRYGPPPDLAARLQPDPKDKWYPLIECFCARITKKSASNVFASNPPRPFLQPVRPG
jgi:hypothetical protein